MSSAENTQKNEEDFAYWEKSQEYFAEGYVAESDFFLTRHFTKEIHGFSELIDLFGELDKREYKPLHFISGQYSDEFIEYFFIGSWFQWRTSVVDEDNLSVLTESAMDDSRELYAEVWGQPSLSKWSIIAKDDVYSAYALGFGDTSISHGKVTISEQGISCKDIEIAGQLVKIFTPVFEDISNDGNPELLLRYNLATGDGYIQYLQIYQSSFHDDTCSTRLLKEFSARNGFVLHSDQVFTIGTQTALENESWLSASQHLVEEISYDGETEKTLGQKTLTNVLRGDDPRFWN
ncbi:MAG: hypothetical protein VX884_03070 [Pseudomonadota bacterium]|nr:hypothetical protein [Pseudomonadota bacterium]